MSDEEGREEGRVERLRRTARITTIVYGTLIVIGAIVIVVVGYYDVGFSFDIIIPASLVGSLGVMMLLFRDSFSELVSRMAIAMAAASPGRVSAEILSEVNALRERSEGTSGGRERQSKRPKSEPEQSARELGVDEIFDIFRNRMLKEVFRIQSAANKNLFVGILFCASGAALLIFFSAAITTPIVDKYAGKYSFAELSGIITVSMFPRLLVGILVSAVGYFFLRLYMSNEMDIKHTKNEITNIESRVIAFKIYESAIKTASSAPSGMLKDIDAINGVIASFASTERNFVVETGKSTASRESLSELSKSLDIIESIVDRLGPKGEPK